MTKQVGGTFTIGGLYSHNIWSNGSIYVNISISVADKYDFKVLALGQSAGGLLPIMDVTIDGVLLQRYNVLTDTYNNYDFTHYLDVGVHQVVISFVNDASG